MSDTDIERVTIPDELLAEVAAHPERFQAFDRARWSPALILAAPRDALVGRVMTPWARGGGFLSGELFSTDLGDCPRDGACKCSHSPARATAWALVGSAAEPDSPHPQVGDRVLILGDGPPSPGFGDLVGDVESIQPDARLFVDCPDGQAVGIERWAILPPALEAAR